MKAKHSKVKHSVYTKYLTLTSTNFSIDCIVHFGKCPSYKKHSKVAFKVRLSPCKKNCVFCLIQSPLKMMKNAFYFILKALFVLKIFKFFFFFYLGFLSRTFTIHRTVGERGGYLFNSSLPVPPASQTLRH